MRPRDRLPVRRGVLWPLVLIVLLGACKDGASPREQLDASTQETIEAGSARVATTVENKGGAAPGRFGGEGVIDFRARRGRIAFDLSGFGLGGPDKTELLFLPGVFYVELPPELGEVAVRPWLRIDAASIGQATGPLEGFRRLGNNDPTVAVNLIRGASGKVEEVGREEVRGTPTTQFKTTLDLDNLRSDVPAATEEAVARFGETLGVRFVPTEAWVGEDGRLRRIRQTMDLSQARATRLSGTLVTTFELFDFGTKTDVQEPPPDQVTDLATVMQGATPR